LPLHHILPRFYLEGFLDPQTPPGHEPFLWETDLVNGKVRKRAPKKAAARSNYYLVDTSVDRHLDANSAEARLAESESESAPLLRNFLSDPSGNRVLAPQLGMFVALLGARTFWLRRIADEGWHYPPTCALLDAMRTLRCLIRDHRMTANDFDDHHGGEHDAIDDLPDEENEDSLF
jgi:hypothetical protein